MSDAEEFELAVGVIVRPHGVRGEVRVRPTTDRPEVFDKLEEVLVGRAGQPSRRLRIEGARMHQGVILVKFKGIDNREAAEELRSAELCIRRADSVPLKPDEFLVADVIGLEVVTTQGERVGPVLEVLATGAHDVYVTERGMIPAVSEFVKEIDLAGGKMVIEPQPGLLKGFGGDE